MDYKHGKRICKDFEIKNLDEYHDLYLKSHVLPFSWCFWKLLKNVFKNLSIRSCRIYLAPGLLAWQNFLKKTEVKLEISTDTDVLSMVEKGTRRGIWYAIQQNEKTNNKYMTEYDKNKESSYLHYLDVNNLYGWAMPQKLPVNNLEWIEETSQFNKELKQKTINKL